MDSVQHITTDYGADAWIDDNGDYHSVCDKPAIIFDDGTREWWLHGKTHRDGDKPAIIDAGKEHGATVRCLLREALAR